MRPLHEERADELLSLYKFLITLYIPEEALKIPPAEGWPEETIRAHFNPDEKDEAVIKVLKHIPFLQGLDRDIFQFWENCVCNDFSGPRTGWTEPLEKMMDGCGWPILETGRGRYLATIGMSSGRNGFWVFCDVRSREMIVVDFQVGWTAVDDSPSEFISGVKEDFRRLDVFPDSHMDVRFLHKYDAAEMERVRKLFGKHGWPTENYRKEECLAELARSDL
ncbi:hypothetical protein BST61_g5449 [Cercospora zeina]